MTTQQITDYIRGRAEQLRTKRHNAQRDTLSEVERAENRAAARQLEIVADEIDADFHIDEEDE